MTCRLCNCGIDTKTSILEYASNVFAILLRESLYWSQTALQNDDGIVKIKSHGERRYLQLDSSLQNADDDSNEERVECCFYKTVAKIKKPTP